MNLYLLRHGLAGDLEAHGLAQDSERPLTSKGERKLWRIAEAVKGLELSFDVILSSPYLRARQTAEIIAQALHLGHEIEFSETLTPSGNPKKLVELLKKIGREHVLLVGHEPHLSEFISLLVSGKSGLSVVMKKGGLCKLTIESLSCGRCAALEWLLTPGQMVLMAGE